MGSLAGILLAQQCILANLNPATVDERNELAKTAPEQLNAIVNHELFWVCVPYVGLCAVAACIGFFFFFSKRSSVDEVKHEKTDFKVIFSILVHSPKWYLGVIAQVFYVGVQIAAWTWLNVYCQKELGVTPADGAIYYTIGIVLFIVCRWAASTALPMALPWRCCCPM